MRASASAAKRVSSVNRDSAHTAIARTSGEASSSRRSASPASAASPELPMAISTLRMKRSRPMRLTGEARNSARNSASSSRASSARRGRSSSARAWNFASLRQLCEFVPRAHGQAIVAAIDAVAHRRAEFVRNVALVLDGEIGNAAPRIDAIGRGEGFGRAGVEAFAAAAAMIGFGSVGLQLQRREHRAQKQPGAEIAAHQIGVLALPAQPGGMRQRLFHHRRGVDEHFHIAAMSPRRSSAPAASASSSARRDNRRLAHRRRSRPGRLRLAASRGSLAGP